MTFIACAAMLTSTVILTGCKKEGQNEPQAKVPEVKTEFSISLPSNAASRPLRMPSTTIQKDPATEFQGITGITLVPFAKEARLVAGDTRLGTNISLTTDITSDGAGDTKTFGTASKAVVYSDVAIPLTTASFLFYAKSAAAGEDYEVGALTADLSADHPSGFTFDLKPIITPAANEEATVNSVTASGKGAALLAFLNAVAQASDGETEWRNYTNVKSTAMTTMFSTYSTMKALSSDKIAHMMEDLYKSLKPLRASNALADGIMDVIEGTTGVAIDGSDNLTLSGDLAGFPANLHLPDCAVRIVWDGSSKVFRACTRSEYTADNNAALDLYTYPSSLWYYANSVIKTSNSSKLAMYNNTNTWDDILAAHTSPAAVNSLTRAVAINDVIQYAVARLDVTVKLKQSPLLDNAADPASITPNVAGFPLTGVLIGNQKNVGFDFNPNGVKVQTIYDSEMTTSINAVVGSASAANSTLVLPTAIGAAATNDVMIAIELVNNTGVDFVGVDGIVTPNSKFYLVARLAAASADVTENQVFKQDYTTTANLTIASLASAYSTVPDLRTPQLELGMSVDLNWTPGNTYTVEIP